jgi:hypothetical protein
MRICTLLACSFLLLAGLIANAQQDVSSTRGELVQLVNTVSLKGKVDKIEPKVAEVFGFGRREVPEKILTIKDDDGIVHDARVMVVDGETHLILSRTTQKEAWIIEASLTGEYVLGRHIDLGAKVLRPSGLDEGRKVLSLEKPYWLKWLADGAKIPPKI